MKTKEMPSIHEIQSLFSYDKETGIFTPLSTVSPYVSSKGYIQLWINKKLYMAHRCAMHLSGYDVEGFEVDHINGIKTDNRPCNLRLVDRGENCRNAKKRRDNKSGVTGVYFWSTKGLWVADIQINGKRKVIGRFKDKDAAINARKDAEKALDFTDRHGK